jgi:hypothetical protein
MTPYGTHHVEGVRCGAVPGSASTPAAPGREFPERFLPYRLIVLYPMGSCPMPERNDHKEIARVMIGQTARVLAVAEWWLRPADQLDYVVRRWLVPIPFGEGTRSMHKEASMRSSVALSPVQAAIGQRLRAQYAIERSVPGRLANLLKEFEQRNNEPEAFARAGYASAA